MSEPGLLTARELAEHLGVKPGTVLDWYEAGKLPGFKFGRAVRFDLDEVLATGRQAKAPREVTPSHPPQRRGEVTIALAKPPPKEETPDA